MTNSDSVSRRSAAMTVLVLLVVAAPVAVRAAGADLPSILIIGDTQRLSQDHPANMEAVGTYIHDNKDVLNIAAVFHMGDWIQTIGDEAGEGPIARSCVDAFRNDGIPWALTLGNHEYQAGGCCHDGIQYIRQPPNLPINLVTNELWFIDRMVDSDADDRGYTYAFEFLIDDEPQLGVVLPFGPTCAMLEWTMAICDEYLDRRVWIVSHAWLDGSGEHLSAAAGHFYAPSTYYWNEELETLDPPEVWDQYFKYIPNLAFIFSGHATNGPAVHRTDIGVNGNLVHQLLVNAQEQARGGDGYLQIMSVDLAAGLVQVETLRPITGVRPVSNEEVFTLRLSASCTADVDYNGMVNIVDLIAVLTDWGPCFACPTDIDQDGLVGITDLLLILAHWGVCPPI